MSAPAGNATSSDSNEYFTDSDIAEMRSDLKEIPGINPKLIDDFADVFAKFRKNATENEVIEAVVSITCCIFIIFDTM